VSSFDVINKASFWRI